MPLSVRMDEAADSGQHKPYPQPERATDMQTFTFDCDLDAQRGVVLRLPSSVLPGRHRLAVIVDPPDAVGARTAGPAITPIDEGAAPRTDLWRRLESLRAQAIDAGELLPPMAWDAVLAEAERRRGEHDD